MKRGRAVVKAAKEQGWTKNLLGNYERDGVEVRREGFQKWVRRESETSTTFRSMSEAMSLE